MQLGHFYFNYCPYCIFIAIRPFLFQLLHLLYFYCNKNSIILLIILYYCRNSQTVENDEPVISKPEECSKISNDDSAQEWCPRLHTCHACVATKGCEWEGTKISDFNCRPIEPARPLPPLPLPKNSTNIEKPDKTLSDLVKPPPNSCGLSCSERTSCMNCTNR